MASMLSVDQIYSLYDILNNDNSSKEKKDEAFLNLLSGFKDGEKEKRLSSQFISRFFKDFKAHQETSFNILLDLCDDPNVDIRKQAVHDIQVICKHEPSFISRELNIVALSLSHLLHQEPLTTLEGIFSYILSDNTQNREVIIKFLADRIKTLSESQLVSNLEQFIIDQTQSLLLTASTSEFVYIMSLYTTLKAFSSVPGRQRLIAIIYEHIHQIFPKFMKNVHSGDFFDYLFDIVMPVLIQIGPKSSFEYLKLLRLIAQISEHSRSLIGEKKQNPDFDNQQNTILSTRLVNAFSLLESFLPDLPPTNDLKETTESDKADLKLHIEELEAILFIVRQLGQLLTSSSLNETKLDPVFNNNLVNARPRLQILARKTQEQIQKVANLIASQSDDQQKSDSLVLGSQLEKILLHKSLCNVHLLVMGLFRNPPSFKPISVNLSWLPQPTIVSANAVSSSANDKTMKTISTYSRGSNNNYDNNRFQNRPKPYSRPNFGFQGNLRRGSLRY